MRSKMLSSFGVLQSLSVCAASWCSNLAKNIRCLTYCRASPWKPLQLSVWRSSLQSLMYHCHGAENWMIAVLSLVALSPACLCFALIHPSASTELLWNRAIHIWPTQIQLFLVQQNHSCSVVRCSLWPNNTDLKSILNIGTVKID